MVRPVEPDPPKPVLRTPGGVRQTSATPEQLGHTPVSEQDDRPGRRKGKPGKPPASDTVSIESGAPTAPKADPAPATDRSADRQEHVDLRG